MKNFTINIQNIYTKVIIFILVMASYINVLKPLTGIRWWPFIVDILLVLTILIYLLVIKLIIENKSLLTFLKIEFVVFLFLFISLFQIFNYNVPTLFAGLEGFRKTAFQMLGFLLGIYFIYDYIQVEKIIKYIYFLLIPVLLYGIKQFFYFSPFDYKIIDMNLAGYWTYHIFDRVRAISIFSGPFHFGMFSCLMSLLSLYFFLKKGKLIYLIIFYISVLGVFFSMTRVNVIALIITTLFFLWFSKPRTQKFSKILLIIFTVTLFMVVVILWNFSYVVKLFSSILEITEDLRFLGRFRGYRRILEAFVKNPIIGYGMGSAGDTLGYQYNWEFHVTSHNMFLKVLTETGLIGIIIYIGFFFMWFKRAFSLVKQDRNNYIKNFSVLVISIVIVLLVNGLTGSSIEAYPISLYVWFFMGVLIKIWLLDKESIKRENENRFDYFPNA